MILWCLVPLTSSTVVTTSFQKFMGLRVGLKGGPVRWPANILAHRPGSTLTITSLRKKINALWPLILDKNSQLNYSINYSGSYGWCENTLFHTIWNHEDINIMVWESPCLQLESSKVTMSSSRFPTESGTPNMKALPCDWSKLVSMHEVIGREWSWQIQ